MPPVDRNNPKRAKSSDSEYALMQFMAEFPDDASCLEWLWRNRFSKDGIHAVCHKCRCTTEFARYETSQQRQSWTCTACGHHVHPTAGTIFHKSSTSLHLWFYAMYLMTSTRCGISAKQLERELGVTYKTAWRMFNVIRNSLMSENGITLSGKVEMDETYIVHRRRQNEPVGQHGRSLRERVVMGAVERQGKVVAKYIGSANRTEVEHMTDLHVLPATMVYTDESPIYKRLDGRRDGHPRGTHSA